MSTVPGGLPVPTGTGAPATLESKIVQAASEGVQIVDIFSPAIGHALEVGIALEPLVSGMLHMIVGLFRHHTAQAAKQ